MQQGHSKNSQILLVYQCILAMCAVLAFFTNADFFFFKTELLPPPTKFIPLFFGASLPIWYVFVRDRLRFFLPLVVWLCCFFVLSNLSSGLSRFSDVAVEESTRRMMTIFFVLTMAVIFSGPAVVQLWARRAVFIAMVISGVNVIIELFNPLTFAVIDFVDRPVGTLRYADRPAGLYIDPNKTAFALVLGLIFCIHLLPKKFRIPFILIVGMIIFVTFSRGAIFCWLVLLTFYSFTGVIEGKSILYWGLGTIACLTVLIASGVIDIYQLNAAGILTDDMLGRLEWFKNPLAKEGSADSRMEVAGAAIQMFLERPFLGHGIGSTLDLSTKISTHNTYLYFMADHGLFGAALVPSLIYSSGGGMQGKYRRLGIIFVVIVSLWGCFAHTLTDDRYILISFALMAAMKATDQAQSARGRPSPELAAPPMAMTAQNRSLRS
ncbi:O-antigen ligase family protein [filamentous cyanobacterium LEGE 11480]|uniref:O-antigen ligase family protein n=1 Tax=Romeriopsis navalis LEGE 11480 TaxID=2777977 RepID=A0A928VHG9_9CYAN|nr:O-antigen ligase family protein [Romeriopsis navalis]MBE9028701.1 O-antigen ligase family protein [Romeriopsis navalis LEGE 11480]